MTDGNINANSVIDKDTQKPMTLRIAPSCYVTNTSIWYFMLGTKHPSTPPGTQYQENPPLIAVFACLLLLANATASSAKAALSAQELTGQALQLYDQKQVPQAIDLELRAVKRKPGEWLPHAVLSYFLWHESKSRVAIIEGQLAARLAPRIPLLLINLGIMHQGSGDLGKAVNCFSKARKLAPTDWRAWLGQAQSLILAGRSDEAVSILHEMAALSSNDFNWYYELGQTYLFMNKPGLAADAASKAVVLATTAEQNSASLFQLFLACIRDNQIERAKELEHQVFCDNKPTDAQIYIRAASSLVPVLNPGAADVILNAAAANLAKTNDSETFFRMARIFDERARYVSYDRTKYGAWLNHEELAYRQAIKLNSSPAIYHLGLASVLGQKGNVEEMAQELAKARASDVHDQLTGYLLSKMRPAQVAVTGVQPNLLDGPLSSVCQVHLTEAQIIIRGLSCSCKHRIVANSFRQIRGLVLTTISPKFPYKATVLIDQSMIPIADALVQMTKKKPFPELNYELISSRPIESAGEALKIDLEGRPLNSALFASDFNQLQATLPVNSTGAPVNN